MAGLVPAIYAFLELTQKNQQGVDARDERGHDGPSLLPREIASAARCAASH
jgi:hypothetical protein